MSVVVRHLIHMFLYFIYLFYFIFESEIEKYSSQPSDSLLTLNSSGFKEC